MPPSILHQWLVPHRSEITPGFTVGRALPFRGGQGVGPWIFLDHMGPHTFAKASDADVPPHPHIGLATVTYLFEGELTHRDSIGSNQRIKPGDVNWMTAGSGIVHSERAAEERKEKPATLHGLQAWVALPIADEEVVPTFEHQESAALPHVEIDGATLKIIAGEAFGLRSPVTTHSRLFYVHAELAAEGRLHFDSEGQDVAFYIVSGTVELEGREFTGPGLLHFKPGSVVEFHATDAVRGVLLGGDPLKEHRRIWWNFVSSRPERIEEAKRLWKAQGFPKIEGETEFVPLPN